MSYNILGLTTKEIDKENSLFIILFLLKIFLNIDCVRMPQIVCLGQHGLNISYGSLPGRQQRGISLLAHTSDIDNLLEGLDGVLEDWLNGLHDTESSLHIVNLWLHSLDGLHLSGDLNEWLSIIESLEDSSGKGLLDVLDGGGLGNSGVTITSGLGGEGGGEVGGELGKELILVHVVVLGGGDDGGKGEEFHFFVLFNY